MSARTPRFLQSAFTLVELAAVLTITSLILALAVSAYRTYTVRQQVAEGIRAMMPLKHSVEDSFRRHRDRKSVV